MTVKAEEWAVQTSSTSDATQPLAAWSAGSWGDSQDFSGKGGVMSTGDRVAVCALLAAHVHQCLMGLLLQDRNTKDKTETCRVLATEQSVPNVGRF